MKIPFSAYDFFGYLASGFLFWVGIDFLDGSHDWLLNQDLKLTNGVFWLFTAYISGQTASSYSKLLYESFLVDKILRRPNFNLVRETRPRFRGYLFWEYYTSLPNKARKRVMEKSTRAGVVEGGEDLFVLAWSSVKNLETVGARLDEFRDRYGFNRNISFTFLVVTSIYAVGLIVGYSDQSIIEFMYLGIAFTLLTFVRYLKFFRQYSYEVFTTYSRIDFKDKENTDTRSE